MKTPIVVFITGTGTNLQCILKNCVNVEVIGIVSNNPDKKLHDNNIQHLFLNYSSYDDKKDVEEDILVWMEYILKIQPEFIVLAGFMKTLTPYFINEFKKPILNLHPSLLPKYPGLNTHERVLEAKDNIHGSTVHIVTETLDDGPILAQWNYKIEDLDLTDIKFVGKMLENKNYPLIIDTFAMTNKLKR